MLINEESDSADGTCGKSLKTRFKTLFSFFERLRKMTIEHCRQAKKH